MRLTWCVRKALAETSNVISRHFRRTSASYTRRTLLARLSGSGPANLAKSCSPTSRAAASRIRSASSGRPIRHARRLSSGDLVLRLSTVYL